MLHALIVASCVLGWFPGEPTQKVADSITFANLAVYPIILSSQSHDRGSDYITLDEGVKLKLVEVKEMGDDPVPVPLQRRRPIRNREEPQINSARNSNSQNFQQTQSSGSEVNRLRIINKSNKPLLLLAGEMVVGGKQDRIVQKDTIIKPSPKGVPLAVFCVEQGRWESGKSAFGTTAGGFGGNVADPTVRGVAQSKNEQGAVWSSVSGRNGQLGTSNETQTYQGAITSKKVQADVNAYVKAIEAKFPKDAVGAIVAIYGKLVWIDFFPTSSSLFKAYWPKLLRSYAIDAVSAVSKKSTYKVPSVQEAAAFLEDRSGNATFEGQDKVFKLTRTESSKFVIYDIDDIRAKPAVRLHTCKMLKR